MAYNSDIISAPVSIYDVQRAVSKSSPDLGTLITTGTINMWAKYKPVRWAEINTMDYLNGRSWISDDHYVTNSPWWRSNNGGFGLDFSGATVTSSTASNGLANALTSIAALIDGGLNGWAYNRPSGGTTAPYRLLDFNLYNANAPHPVSGVTGSPKISASTESKWSYKLSLREVNAGNIKDRDYIIPKDIISTYSSIFIEDMIVGYAIFKIVNGAYKAIAWTTDYAWYGSGIYSADSSLDDIVYGDESCVANFKAGTYYALPVYFSKACAQPISGASKNAALRLWTIPYTNFIQFQAVKRSTTNTVATVTTSSHIIDVSGTTATTGTLSAVIRADATDTSTYTGGSLGTVIVAVVNETWDGSTSPSPDMYAYWHQFSNVQVLRDNTADIASLSSLTLSLSHTWQIYVLTSIGDEFYFPLIQPAQPYA